MRRWLDRALVAGALLVIGAAVASTLLGTHGHRQPARVSEPEPELAPAAEPATISLHSSPDVAFLPDCRQAALRLAIAPRDLVLRYTGPPCHLRRLTATANVVDAKGALVLRGDVAVFSGNLAGAAELRSPLLRRLARCVAGAPLTVLVLADSLRAQAQLLCPLDAADQ